MRRACFTTLAGLVFGGALVAQSTPASAFLDFLFGGGRQAPVYAPPPSYSSRPLDVSVIPRRRARGHAERGRARHDMVRRKDDKSKTQHAAKESGERRAPAKNQVQRSIDPVANPDWYLKDPNLRYGDILILKSGAVVYQGSRSARVREDFVSLGKSSAVSGSSLRDIRMMVSGVWTPPEAGSAEPVKRRRSRR